MSERHYDHPLAAFEKLAAEQSKEINRLYLQKLVVDKREQLEDFLRNPPRTDGFGNAYSGTREDAIRCFLNNFAVDMKIDLSLQECIREINTALGWSGEMNSRQYSGKQIAGNELADNGGFINWLKKLVK